MKLFYLFIPVVFLLFVSCSSTYKVTDYPSKEAFHKDFNNSAKDTKVKVTLINDSSFSVSEGAEIRGDSLHLDYYPSYYPSRLRLKNENILLNDVQQASYKNHLKGILPGAGIGLPSGIFLGSLITVASGRREGGNQRNRDWVTGAYWGFIIGPVVGAIVGYIVGWNNIYLFNP